MRKDLTKAQNLSPAIKDSLTASTRLLDSYLTIYNSGGFVVGGKEKMDISSIDTEKCLNMASMTTYGQEKPLIAVLALAIKEVWTNAESGFTNDGVAACAITLSREYGYLKAKDVVLMLRNGLLGKYGKVYGKVNTMTILEWAGKYDEERTAYFEQPKGQTDWRQIDPDLLRGFEFKEEKKSTPIHNEPEIQKLFKEFDELRKEQNRRDIFVEYEGKTLSQEEYVKYKLSQ